MDYLYQVMDLSQLIFICDICIIFVAPYIYVQNTITEKLLMTCSPDVHIALYHDIRCSIILKI